jgi:thiosulfate dehydrogenase
MYGNAQNHHPFQQQRLPQIPPRLRLRLPGHHRRRLGVSEVRQPARRPFPFEKQLVHLPLNARVDRELQQPPFAVSEDVYEAGAHVYKQQCAACHGAPGQTVAYARWMYPVAPALWQKHSHGNVVGVSDDDPGETFWKIKNGIRLSGMPSYENLLSNDEMWDVALLLKNADQQLPDPVRTILTAK